MQNFVFLIFLEIFAITQASKPRSVNVALETVLEFDKKYDVDFINTMQKFLRKLKTTLVKTNSNDRPSKRLRIDNEDNNKTFLLANFLADTIDILKSYEDEDLKTFFDSLDGEVKAWQTRKEIQKFTDKVGFRRLVERNLQSLKNSPVTEIRRKLNSLSDKLNLSDRNANDGFVANFLNYIYKKESEAKLLNIINNLKLYRSGRRRGNLTDLKRIIRSGFLTVIDPLLKLNSTTVSRINTFFYKFVGNSLEKKSDNDLNKNSKYKERSDKAIRPNHKLYNVLRENKVLDYIEDHQKVIDEHLTTRIVAIEKTFKTKPKILETINTTYHNKHTTKSRKKKNSKHKRGKLVKVKIPQEKNNDKEGVKNESVDENNQKPVLIKLVSHDRSELKSLEEYLSSTSKRQKRFKKTTRGKMTTKKSHVHIKSTDKFRKAFRTTQFSDKGMSIEHFGSLFGKEYHRKNNDINTFTQTISNVSETTESYGENFTRYESGNISTEIRRNLNVSRENEENYKEENPNETNKTSKSVEEDVKDTKTLDINKDVIAESIKIKGDIILKKPTVSTTRVIEKTTSRPVNNFTTYKKFNVSIVTKYFNIKPMKTKINLRQQDTEEVNIPRTSRIQTATSAQTTKVIAKQTEIDNIKTTDNELQTAEDGLQNESEGVTDKTDKDETGVPPEFENFVMQAQNNKDVNSKIKEQMKADLASLLATRSTKTTATELFTDPFDDIDLGDIL